MEAEKRLKEIIETIKKIENKSILLEPEVLESYISFNDRIEFYMERPNFVTMSTPYDDKIAHSIFLDGIRLWVEENEGLVHLFVKHPEYGTVTYYITKKALCVMPKETLTWYLLPIITDMVEKLQNKAEEEWQTST